MSKTLVLAEKPSVGRDIGKALGVGTSREGYLENEKYIITWALGHLVTLADPESYNKKFEKWDLNDLPIIPQKLELVVIGKTAKQYNTVKAQMQRKDVGLIVIATDAGREGELVARWILSKAKINKPLKRLWISSVTGKAIREGFQKLKDGKDYENLYRSAVARAEADWLVGINATRALTTKHNAQLSCGRVQTPTLAMIAKREQDIQGFVPKTYFGITARVKDTTFVWQRQNNTSTFDQQLCDDIIAGLKNAGGQIIDVVKTKKKTMPPLPYDLTQLQADGSRIFGFSAKETLNAMQGLYETHKVLTYPRTDSKYLTSDITDSLGARIKACSVGPYKKFCYPLSQVKFTKNAHYIDDQKVSDHHAIIPTEESPILENMSEKERKIYDLVVKRFLAALYPPFEYEQTDLSLKIGQEIFKAKGKRALVLGYKEIQLSEDGEEGEQLLPEFKKGEACKPQMNKTTGKTKPPTPLNEGTLLTAMEAGGLGTVATRADIIEKLFSTFVIEKKGKDLFITPKGRQLLQLVPEELTSPMLTASWEQRLIQISQGREDYKKFLDEIAGYTRVIITQIKASKESFRHDNVSRERCPECGKFMLDVAGKKGRLLVCPDRECGFRQSVSIITNARCPVCHKKLELVGQGEKRKFICACGYKEGYEAFQERREKEGRGVSKKEVENYLRNQKKEEPVNSALAKALEGLKF